MNDGAFPSFKHTLISLVSRDTSTEPKYSYLIWGALLTGLSQPLVALVVVVVVVVFLFLSISVLLTIPWVYFLLPAFLPHPDPCQSPMV